MRARRSQEEESSGQPKAEAPRWGVWRNLRAIPTVSKRMKVSEPGRQNSSPATNSGGDMAREYEVIVERDSDGWYVATVPALRGCHTQAQTLDELRERVREAILVCLEDNPDDGPERLDFVGIERITA